MRLDAGRRASQIALLDWLKAGRYRKLFGNLVWRSAFGSRRYLIGKQRRNSRNGNGAIGFFHRLWRQLSDFRV
jgi:hypothetical protein